MFYYFIFPYIFLLIHLTSFYFVFRCSKLVSFCNLLLSGSKAYLLPSFCPLFLDTPVSLPLLFIIPMMSNIPWLTQTFVSSSRIDFILREGSSFEPSYLYFPYPYSLMMIPPPSILCAWLQKKLGQCKRNKDMVLMMVRQW